MPFPLFILPVFLIFVGSQIYWLFRIRGWVRDRIARQTTRWIVLAALAAVYVLVAAFNFGWFGPEETPTRMTFSHALLKAPFLWWVFSSMVAFLLVGIMALGRQFARLFRRRSDVALESPPRRRFLEHSATAVAALPFVAGGYGLLYGRLNLETTTRRIGLGKLPAAFEGFRIVQLSDIHVGPFMSEEEIRKYAGIANSLRPDLIVLTGDFITWDPATQPAVVQALSGLRAPLGVFGCLGNHERWSNTEDSITALFAAAHIRILRRTRALITTHGESFNLIGVDYNSPRHGELLEGVEELKAPGMVNILLSHNPDTFDRAAELGIDLSLAGHTHGGQVALELISPQIAPSRIVTPYVSGWFEKPGGQLYVNRGIGTVGAPMRIGAPPEITVFELTRRRSGSELS